MRKLFLLITLLSAFAAAGSAQITVPVKKGATLPATCSATDIQTLLFYKTGASNGLYYCSATNTWTITRADVSTLTTGPGSSTDNAIARFDGTTGKVIQNSPVTVADTTGAIAGAQSIALSGSTSGALTVRPPPIAGTNTLTLPAGTTDFSATGGTSQVVKQTTSGGALTVGQLAASDLSNGTTGSGNVVLKTSPALTTPDLGTPSALVATNATGTASGLTAGHVTTNANLTGPITSSGNATSVAAQTGTGTTFVMQASPTLTTPTLGVASATSVNKVAITAPATSATLTIADGKTATVNNSLTLVGTDSTTMTFPSTSATIARTDAANTFTGTQTFNSTISGSINGNAATVTTNANLTGDVTSSGNATTVGKINGTSLAGLATGILKNTTSTGVPSIAVAGDFPTLNQNTTGSAATLTTPRAINGVNFDGSAAITVTAAAGTLTGSTLATGVTSSSLTAFGPSPNLSGGTHNAVTSLGLRSTGASFDLKLASSEAITADRTVSFVTGDASRTVTLFGSTTIPVASQQITFSGLTAARTITLPDASFTVARTDAANTFTGHQTIEGVTSTGATGTGKFVFDTSPDFTTGATIGSVAIPTISSTNTLTNKRITKRIGTETSSSTSTPTADTVDQWNVTALATSDTFAAPTGTPTDGQLLTVRIKDNGTARALAWNAIYRFSSDLAAPTTTVLSKTLYILFVYNAADSKWDCLAILNNL